MEIIVIGAIALLVIFAIAQYNRLVRLNITVDEAFAQIEVQLKRRADLIPNLVETVKGYAAHEQSTFNAVVEARAKSTSATTVADVAAADGALTNALKHRQTFSLYKKSSRQLRIKFHSHVSSTTTLCARLTQRLKPFLQTSLLALQRSTCANSMRLKTLQIATFLTLSSKVTYG